MDWRQINLAALIINVANWLASRVGASGNEVLGSLDDVESTVLESILSQTDELINVENLSTDSILESITTNAEQAAAQSDASENRITSVITDAIETESRSTNQRNQSRMVSIIDRVLDVGSSVTALDEKVDSEIGGLAGIMSGVLGTLGDIASSAMQPNIIIEGGIFDRIIEATGSAIRGAIDIVEDTHGETIEKARDTIGLEDTGFEEEETDVVSSIDEVGKIIKDKTSEGNNELNRIADSSSEMVNVLDWFTGQKDDDYEAPSKEDIKNALQAINPETDILNCIEQAGFSFPEEAAGTALSISGWITNLFAGLLAAVAVPGAISGAEVRNFMYKYSLCNPNLKIPEAEIISNLHKGVIDANEAEIRFRQLGYSIEDSRLIMSASELIPDVGILFELVYRGLMDEKELDKKLQALGYSPEDTEGIAELRHLIPSPQDLITMSVREVFSPTIRATQKQDEGFPEEFAFWGEKIGLSRYWCENFWASHWNLPGINQFFAMLHRGVITKEELELALRTADVMPGWREPLIEIAYRPYSRVDIRRMHATEVLSLEEVKRAYLDLGYNDEKAQKLTDFTEALNAEDELLSADVASDLTRSSILSFYKDGIINKVVTFALLAQGGVNLGAATLFIVQADLEVEQKVRKQSTNIVLDRYRFGSITAGEAADELQSLGFESRELELALLDLRALEARSNKQPSKADLGNFLSANIITEETYLLQMERLGYSDVWSDRYLELETAGSE